MPGKDTRKSQPTKGRERQQRYMAKLRADPERFAAFKEKERERYHQNKAKGKKPTARETRHQRKRWRESQQKCRQKQKMEAAEKHLLENSPGISSEDADTSSSPEPGCSAQKKRGRKQVRRDRSRLFRKVESLQEALKIAKRRAERYKKRLQRFSLQTNSTPQKQTQKLLGGSTVPKKVHRALMFSSAIILAIKQKYKSSKSYREKQFIAKLLSARIKRYRMSSEAQSTLGIPRRSINAADHDRLLLYSRKCSESVGTRLANSVQEFFCRDDNSRITTSKTDTKSKNGVKKQRRILMETLTRLHAKYRVETGNTISYSLFCKMKPFFVVAPTNEDRETCLCKLHENGRLLVERLHQLRRLPADVDSVGSCVNAAVCAEPNHDCYERNCNHCKNRLEFPEIINNPEDTITWHKWII